MQYRYEDNNDNWMHSYESNTRASLIEAMLFGPKRIISPKLP
jgi:hypothetical protein